MSEDYKKDVEETMKSFSEEKFEDLMANTWGRMIMYELLNSHKRYLGYKIVESRAITEDQIRDYHMSIRNNDKYLKHKRNSELLQKIISEYEIRTGKTDKIETIEEIVEKYFKN